MRPVFDECLKYAWEHLKEGGIAAKTFYLSHKFVLALFADAKDFEQIFAADASLSAAADEIKRDASSSAVGMAMFKGEVVKVARITLQKTICHKLLDLQHLDFDQVPLGAFKESMVKEGRELVKLGAKPFDRVASTMGYIGGVPVKIWAESINDGWEFRLGRRLAPRAMDLPFPLFASAG